MTQQVNELKDSFKKQINADASETLAIDTSFSSNILQYSDNSYDGDCDDDDAYY